MKVKVGNLGLPGDRFTSSRDIIKQAQRLQKEAHEVAEVLKPLDNQAGVDLVTWDSKGGIVAVDLTQLDKKIPELEKWGIERAELHYNSNSTDGDSVLVNSVEASGVDPTYGNVRWAAVTRDGNTSFLVDEGPYHYRLVVNDKGTIFCQGFKEDEL